MNGPIQFYVPFPLDAYPSLLGEATNEVAMNLKIAYESAAAIVLATAAISVQDKIKAKHPHGQVGGVSLYVNVEGKSGSRKTTAIELIAKPVYEFDKAMALKGCNAQVHGDMQVATWSAINEGLLEKLTVAAKKGHPTAGILREIEEHASRKPIQARVPRLIYNDLTKSALGEALEGIGKSMAIMSDEGGGVFASGLLGELSLLNSLWSGGTLALDRANGSSIVAHDPHVSVLLGVQPGVFQEYLEKRGEAARASGFLARFLMTPQVSLTGYRFVESVKAPAWPYLEKFHARVRELLEETTCRDESGAPVYTVLELDEDAKVRWMYHSNAIEAAMQPGAQLCEVSDFASKAMENTMRIAAVLHHFTKREGLISVDTFERAYAIASYHLEVAKQLFSEIPMFMQLSEDCNKLVHYLRRLYSIGFQQRNRADIYRNGPLRNDRARFGMAIDYLCRQGVIAVAQAKSKALIVCLNPQYFSAQPRC